MIDLAARVHYKVHFDVVKRFNDVNLFDEFILIIHDWLDRKYREKIFFWNWQQIRRFGEFSANDHSVYAKSTSYTNETGLLNWACKVDEFELSQYDGTESYHIKKAPRIWTSEFGFQQISPDRATISFVVYYRDKPGFIGTVDDLPGRNVPGVVRNLLYHKKLDCFIGTDKLFTHELTINPGEGKALAEKIVSEERIVPYILLVPDDAQGGESIYPVSARNISNNVMGNAMVYILGNVGVLEEMSYFVDRQYVPRKGEIMIYWPMTSSSMQKCRYITATQASALGEEKIILIFRRVFSNDIRYTDSREMFRIEDCEELYKQKRVAELRERIAAVKATADRKDATNAELKQQIEFTEEYLKLVEGDKEYSQQTIDTLNTQLGEMKEENWKLQKRVDYLNSYQEEARGVRQSLDAIRNITDLPQSATDIAVFFRNVFRDKLDFTDRGMRSLQDCTTRLAIIWQCFYAIATSLTDLYKGGVADIEAAFKAQTGWDMARGEGAQTRKDKDFMNLRKDYYQGREILIEPHVRNGNKESSPDFIRIYFCFDKPTQKIVIGHVGAHLENFSSQNV